MATDWRCAGNGFLQRPKVVIHQAVLGEVADRAARESIGDTHIVARPPPIRLTYVNAAGPAGPEPFATVYQSWSPVVEQISAKSALFTAAVFVLSCVEWTMELEPPMRTLAGPQVTLLLPE